MPTSHFGAWLRHQRAARGLSQEALAAPLNISLALLRKLEAGERRPSVQVASVIAHWFSIPSEERAAFVAFARTGPGNADASPADRSETPWLRHFSTKCRVPIGPNPLVGREREVESLRAFLLQPRTRLVTLTGIGGVGKTRLATEVAVSLVDHFSDGCFFVDLAATLDPHQVLPTIARELGLQEEPGRSLVDALYAFVRSRRLLLILDNFEHVLDAAVAVARLHQASPWLKLLITSRMPLRIRGERRFVVAPLGVPHPANVASAVSALDSPAVALFCQRAQDVDPTFGLSQANVADVIAICIRLHGLPLAIELAAARVRPGVLTGLLQGLSDALGLLTAGARDLPPRQRTLRASIAWSYDLLSSDEQRLFRFLSTFVGGVLAPDLRSLDDVEATRSQNETTRAYPPPDATIVDCLDALVDKNLVIADGAVAPNGQANEPRYRLLETIRDFAHVEATRAGEVESFRARHASHYLALALEADRHFIQPQGADWGLKQIEWIQRLIAELGNLRSALDWYDGQAQIHRGGALNLPAHLGLRLATAMRRVWFIGGHFDEGLAWLRGFAARMPQPIDSASADIRLDVAEALAVIGRLAPSTGDSAGAVAPLEECLRIATTLENSRLTAYALLMLGWASLTEGDHAVAHASLTQCLALYRSADNPWGSAAALEDLGRLALDQGDAERARPLLEESRVLYESVGDAFGLSSVAENLGRLAYMAGDYAGARRVWQKVVEARRTLGYTGALGRALAALGWSALQLNEVEAARAHWAEALEIAWTRGSVSTTYECLVGFGAVAAAMKQGKLAARLFGCVAAYRERTTLFVSPASRSSEVYWTEMARAQMPANEWDMHTQDGRMIPVEAMVHELQPSPANPRVIPSLIRQ